MVLGVIPPFHPDPADGPAVGELASRSTLDEDEGDLESELASNRDFNLDGLGANKNPSAAVVVLPELPTFGPVCRARDFPGVLIRSEMGVPLT